MNFLNAALFLDSFRDGMYYVGFLKSKHGWFPFCVVSQPEENQALDTLCLSGSFPIMKEYLESYLQRIPQAEQCFVQYMTRDEIRDLVSHYGLEKVGMVSAEMNEEGCGCGCGCGCR